ncbi:4515_t:CDS:10 [Diversispora eburnea]|uniref:4515_t:CDS:1 n=1 Tax=Diversispora eburnea TaxID=1213867 RepID=A0A9N9AG67_9GLOM|nr:4515_t:CDS:10 [Diversispora eburnea]
MTKRNFKPLTVLKDEVQQEYGKTREEFYNEKRTESQILVRETSHRKKRIDKRPAMIIPIQNEVPKYALWTPIARSSKKSAFNINSEPSKTSSTPSTTSRLTRSPVTANRSIHVEDENEEDSDLPFVELIINALSKVLKGKDMKVMVKYTRKLESKANIASELERPSNNKKRPRPTSGKTKPCGTLCYLNLKNDHPHDLLSSQIPIHDDYWDDTEIALFRKSTDLIGTKNYCNIASIIMTKSYTIKDDDVEINSSSDESRKKSKRMAKIEIDAENHSEYHPCDHPGKPCDMNCPCKKGNVPCCNCSGSGKTCSNRSCLCFSNYRECDPDLCKCAASEPLNTQFIARHGCKNVSIQRQQTKRTIVGISSVAGWGLFVREHVKKNEFLGEYIGEADRRGKIYDKRGISFLFNLNKDFVVDATRKGNKFRFINHSNDPNTYCRVTLVNGEHRIGIYALGDLDPGQELFFDYRERAPSPVKSSLSNGKFAMKNDY